MQPRALSTTKGGSLLTFKWFPIELCALVKPGFVQLILDGPVDPMALWFLQCDSEIPMVSLWSKPMASSLNTRYHINA